MSEQEYRHIVRVAGRDIDGQEDLIQGLSRIKGVGLRISRAIVSQLGLDPRSRLGYLDEKTIDKIEEMLHDPVDNGFPFWYVNRQRDRRSGKMVHLTGSDLEFTHQNDIERLKRIRAWRGIRHSLGLKVRGQHTRTTGRSGMSVGVSRKKLVAKARAEREE
ncbi:30S ribosomal protein S13 [Candidatus Thorarchaeota archaeon]|nr:MAG: 30S ribosomal protein S13 [Candidatus Thorarchaeota archaeon]